MRRERADTDQERQASPFRCAINTRKSTEEGLAQEFNTLHAQRESAEAYIRSQVHAGWTALPERYDDGGYTGANLERPALRKLLIDIEAGRIDAVLTYKVRCDQGVAHAGDLASPEWDIARAASANGFAATERSCRARSSMEALRRRPLPGGFVREGWHQLQPPKTLKDRLAVQVDYDFLANACGLASSLSWEYYPPSEVPPMASLPTRPKPDVEEYYPK